MVEGQTICDSFISFEVKGWLEPNQPSINKESGQMSEIISHLSDDY